MYNILWTEDAWNEYVEWQSEDRKTLKKINVLIKDIQRSGLTGLGKAEPLKGNLSGLWSRCIDQYNRLVYRIESKTPPFRIEIVGCKTHYPTAA